ncbi:MAG: DUF4838 domain-containing protein, partial [Verrucomicrobia bacterium]|nr:DUF4838 domain-containing protein [Verrucomicrobiota bacterium]
MGGRRARQGSNLTEAHARRLMLSRCFASLLASVLATSAATSSPGLLLARDGRAELPVVVSAKASETTTQTARELADYLSRITAATFAVETNDGSRGIVLGTLAEFPNSKLAGPLAVRRVHDGKEAFAIRTEPKRLLLIGATEKGVPHAAFRFLESVGCRWFFPAKEWEIVPPIPTLSVSLNETSRPALLARRIWCGYGVRDAPTRQSLTDWARHNRMASSFTIYCGHAWQSIILENKKVFEAHPEYCALVKGKRKGEQLCVSNPAVREIAAEWALKKLRAKPETDMVSMECSDGDGQCECDACGQLGSLSDRIFGLANEVARAVAKEFPGKMIGMLAYNQHCEPPSFPLERNVYVQLTAGFIRGRYTFDELAKLWPKCCKNLGFYEYFSVWLWDFDMPARGRGSNVGYIREHIQRYAKLGATSLDCESGNNWGPHGLGYYIANKLMWNPNADVEALRADFFEKAFGPAAGPMRRFYDSLDAGNEPLRSEHWLALALRDLEEASRLAKDRPDVLARLAHLKQYMHYVRLRWEYDHTTDKPRRRELALAALTHVHRNRRTCMNHWDAQWQSWTDAAAKEFNEPAWSLRDKSPDKPWKVETPNTADETEQQFREDMEVLRPQPVAEIAFSSDLVPAGFHTDKPAETNQRFQRGARYALYSRGGEPLQVSITTGVIAWYRDRADARYTVTNAAGKEIASGRLPQDGKEHALTIKVRAAGLHWLDYNDQGAAWAIKAAPGAPVTLALQRVTHPNHLGHMQRVYFYVPKGTRQLHHFWDGGPHDVL